MDDAVSAKLHQVRLGAGLSQAELAARLGVCRGWVGARERGRASLDLVAFIRWCNACGVDVEQVFATLVDETGVWPKLASLDGDALTSAGS